MDIKLIKDKYTNENSRFIEINGLNVHYRDEGEGEVLLLVHGVFSSLHTFDIWSDILSVHYRVLRLDLPGFGITGPSLNNEYGINLFVNCLVEFLDKLNVEEFSVAGNSLGGWLTWELVLAHEKRVKKMILLNSAGYINKSEYPLPFIIAQTPVLRNVFNYKVLPKVIVRRFLRQVFHDQRMITDQMIDRYYDLAHREGNMDAFVRLANSKFVQNTHSLRKLVTPSLILWGDQDNWINCKHASFFQKDLKNVTIKIYKNVGHIPMEEIPEESANDVLNFLRK